MIEIDSFERDLLAGIHSCIICGELCRSRSVLGWHLREHSMCTHDYVKQYCYNNTVPLCKCGCGNNVSWHKVKYRYRDFVTGHNRTGIRTASAGGIECRVYKHKIGTFVCKICKITFSKMKSLTSHVQRNHSMSAPEYTIKHLCDGVQPVCAHNNCDHATRYTRLSFKQFCQEHAHDAYVQSGKVGGKAPAWNKGLTKEN